MAKNTKPILNTEFQFEHGRKPVCNPFPIKKQRQFTSNEKRFNENQTNYFMRLLTI